MKLPNPKINIKAPHVKTNFGAVLTLVLLFVILIELYLVYVYFYQKLITGPLVVDQKKIVRVDITTYNSVIDDLNQRQSFLPNNPTPKNPEPFK